MTWNGRGCHRVTIRALESTSFLRCFFQKRLFCNPLFQGFLKKPPFALGGFVKARTVIELTLKHHRTETDFCRPLL